MKYINSWFEKNCNLDSMGLGCWLGMIKLILILIVVISVITIIIRLIIYKHI